jgi:hypothetical protein
MDFHRTEFQQLIGEANPEKVRLRSLVIRTEIQTYVSKKCITHQLGSHISLVFDGSPPTPWIRSKPRKKDIWA